LIKNGFTFTPNVSGTLVLFQNNGDWDVKPQGSLLIVIDGATKRTLEDIDLTSGWDMCILYDLNDILYLTDDEKKLIYYINKARTNPSLFADVYLSHKQYKSSLEKECYSLMKITEGIKPLKVCRDICAVAKLHALDMSNNNLNSHQSSDGKTLKERLVGKSVDLDKIGENISFGIFDPLQIVIDLLVDESDSRGHRKNILDKEFDLIGVSISDHNYYGKCCVQDFVKTL
jgi:uncharacterized protein YkwD